MAYPVQDGFQGYPQQYSAYSTRAHQRQTHAAQSLNVNPYASYAAAPGSQQYVQSQSRPPHPPKSPMTEDGLRPSLPSISNLLGIADGDRPSQDAASQQAQIQAQQQTQFAQQSSQTTFSVPRQPSSYSSQDFSSSQRTAVPPTPPLRNDSGIEGTHSPSTISTGSFLSGGQPYFVGSALNNVEADDQRAAAAAFTKRHSIPSQPNVSPYGAPYTSSPYTQSPGTMSTGSYYSPADPNLHSHGIYHQRPLPSNFPPQPPPMHVPSGQPLPPKVWEHHHYINPSSQATFPQSQDRYICQTCNKAFSRPSSLKIHSHSHTGEKPFKCPHNGCGKSFSVRSNMKRHERGCHAGGTPMGGSSH
ncbi:hypothetical protein LTR37_019093 [Vermiconidia calcicola]|uniref:Uncharacterized protein n=1 Tax=Vermiconidia calcicola TaxID=1690605 RepID=A0ACC3MGZ5_9PEZI|nr:hypothetical protein LTR37_019093 [Vermiconidia calcicola]